VGEENDPIERREGGKMLRRDIRRGGESLCGKIWERTDRDTHASGPKPSKTKFSSLRQPLGGRDIAGASRPLGAERGEKAESFKRHPTACMRSLGCRRIGRTLHDNSAEGRRKTQSQKRGASDVDDHWRQDWGVS